MSVWRLAANGLEVVLADNPGGPPVMARTGARPGARAPERPSDLARFFRRPVPRASLDEDAATGTVVTTSGLGWFGTPSVAGSATDGRNWLLAFATRSVEVGEERMTVRLADEVAGLELDVLFELPVPGGCAEQALTLRNVGGTAFRVDRLVATFVLPHGFDRVLTFAGRWGMEFQERIEPLGVATWSRTNRRGRTSHDCYPGVIALADEGSHGPEAYGVQLGWSGNHQTLIEPLDDGRCVLQIGEHWKPGEVVLEPGEAVTTPTAYLAHAIGGAGGVTAAFHEHARRRVLKWPSPRMAPRPVTLNTWEANYFALDEAKLRAQAEAAAELGVERFVLDDGWFKGRRDDRRALGDWTPDPAIFPEGLGPLARHVEGLGMQFGLWVEPEMVSPDSDLHRARPDWALQVAGRPLLTARHQLVLDLTREEVRGHLFACLDRLLRAAPIRYLKWDMNRDLTAAGDRNGFPACHRQVLGLYELLDRVRAAHPGVEIESCASGGGRADWGILARTHRVWTSDGTDPLTRVGIQHGFLRFSPPEIMGAHVSASSNHQTGRASTLAFRAIVALVGHFGLELDPLTLSPEERAELKAWIALHKRLRPVLHGPASHGHELPEQSGRRGWFSVDKDTDRSVAVLVQERQQDTVHAPPLHLAPPGRHKARRFSIPAPQRPGWARTTPVLDALLAGSLVIGDDEFPIVGLALPELPPQSGLVIEIEPLDD
jgi:alpha-galactosidase